MRKFAPGRGLTIAASVCLVILISLGTWQARKIGPKTAMITQLQTGLSEPPVLLPASPNIVTDEFRRVLVAGSIGRHQTIAIFAMNTKGTGGYHHYTVVDRENLPPVIVNIGWTQKQDFVLPSAFYHQQDFTGVLKKSATRSPFMPENAVATDDFYYADVDDLAHAFGIDAVEYYPMRVFLDHMAGDGAEPVGGQVRLDIPNNHREYMFTWYGLAGALIWVYILVGVTNARRRH